MNYGEGRVVVNITDRNGTFSRPGSEPGGIVYGTITMMDIDGNGVGSPAAVHAELASQPCDGVALTTGRIGVMPSSGGKTVSVAVKDGEQVLETLTVPASGLPAGAVSGGLIIFEYTLNAPEFTIIVDGFRKNIVIIDDM